MLHEKIYSERYKAECIKKLTNFCEKSPVLLSFVTSDEGVTLIHTNSSQRYSFSWNYTIPVKSFIHAIKDVLVEKHYPRMIQTTVTDEPLSPEEAASLLEGGLDPVQLPATVSVTRKRLWRIDRVIVYQDIFILVDEATEELYRYKLKRSCVHFLKNYRGGKFTLESAGDYFFENSILLGKLEPIGA